MKQVRLLILLIFCAFCASAQVVYVNRAATGANNGTSWANAYTNLRTAMRLTTTVGRQIWVAAGTYRVDTTSGFLMNPGVQLYGGFAGTETSLGQRNATTNVTILSGDISGNDVTGNFTSNRTDNALHVIWLRGADTISRAIIDGFSIRGGNTAATPPATPAPTAAAIAAARGGGILLQAKATIRNCIFTDNAGFTGAAVSSNIVGLSDILIRDCTFERNLTPERSIVHILGARNPAVRNCRFLNNRVFRGSFYPQECLGTVVVDSCLFDSNNGGASTGASVFIFGSSVNVTNCVVSRNKTDICAGIFHNGNNLATRRVLIENCLFDRDTATSADFVSGAAHWTASGVTIVKKCRFVNNVTGAGAGGALLNAGGTVPGLRVDVIDCEFTENKAAGAAAAIYNGFGGNMTITGSTFTKNVAEDGAALVTQNEGTNTLVENCRFIENEVKEGGFEDGGAARLTARSSTTFRNCVFEGNKAVRLGGAIQVQNDSTKLVVEGCRFFENSTPGDGGAIFSFAGSDITLNNTVFEGNSSNDFGGALAASGTAADVTDIAIDRCTFKDNSAATQGGAITVQNIPNMTIRNSLFLDNLGDNGGAISNNSTGTDTSRITMTFCTFASNIGSVPCLVQDEAAASHTSMIIQNCIMGEHTGDIYTVEGGTPTVTSRGGNLSRDNTMRTLLTGTNDLNNTDPRFVNLASSDVRLAPGSPCINKGIPVPGVTVDRAGTLRDAQPDMGAYEFVTISAFEPVKALRINMSPNPTANQVVLSVNDDTRGTAVVDFFDVTGKLILELRGEKAAGEWAITQQVNHWATGIYQVRMRIGDTLYAGTLVKE